MEPLLLRALKKHSVERPPVWMMRQAGRYLTEYRELKEKHGFLGLCQTPELAAEVTLQPVDILDVDAAIIFSDIMVVAAPLGLDVVFAPGPKVQTPITSPADIAALKRHDVRENLQFVFDALRLVRADLERRKGQRKALIGFAGAPWTLACYFLHQGPYKHFHGTQVFAAQHPEALQSFLNTLADIVGEYLIGQIESGADAVQLFDTWGGNLGPDDYRRFSLPSTLRVLEYVKRHAPQTPCTLYVNGSGHLLEAMAESGADCLSIDWRTVLASTRERFGERFALQGNFDPTHLFRSPDDVRQETEQMLSAWGEDPRGYVVNLGHGILPQTPRENAKVFVDTVKQYNR